MASEIVPKNTQRESQISPETQAKVKKALGFEDRRTFARYLEHLLRTGLAHRMPGDMAMYQCCTCGQMFPPQELAEHFGPGQGVTPGADKEAIKRTAKWIRRTAWMRSTALRDAGINDTSETVIVGKKPNLVYVKAALWRIYSVGSVALTGRNWRKTRAIADTCRDIFGFQESSEKLGDSLVIRLGESLEQAAENSGKWKVNGNRVRLK